jgi:tetratricopeptide (TPR) repeat protein
LYIVCGESTIHDPAPYLERDSTSAVALWLRAICQSQQEQSDMPLMTANLLENLTQAIALAPANAYLYYNRGNAYVQCLDHQQAIVDYTKAIELDANLAEAYYNRGLAHMALKHSNEATADLSKAGELGLYAAYSLLKNQRK